MHYTLWQNPCPETAQAGRVRIKSHGDLKKKEGIPGYGKKQERPKNRSRGMRELSMKSQVLSRRNCPAGDRPFRDFRQSY
jgi:hypothetical protein